MRSWSPPGRRGLEKRGSADGFVYKGRFRIRDVSLSGNPPPPAASVTSISSAPPASTSAPLPPKACARPAAAVAADGCINSPDVQSDFSDYSFYVAASEVRENDETGRLGNCYKSGQRGCGRLSPGETSDASGGYDSELGKQLLVSPRLPKSAASRAGTSRRCEGEGATNTCSMYVSLLSQSAPFSLQEVLGVRAPLWRCASQALRNTPGPEQKARGASRRHSPSEIKVSRGMQTSATMMLNFAMTSLTLAYVPREPPVSTQSLFVEEAGRPR